MLLGDIESLGEYYKSLAFAISHATDHFVAGIDRSAMSEPQSTKLQILFSEHEKAKDSLKLEDDEWDEFADGAEIRFLRLKEILDTAYHSNHIILIDRYDDAFEPLQGKPWIKDAHGVLMRLLNTMLIENKQLLKGLLIGVHPFSLEHSDASRLTSIPTISLTTYSYWLNQADVRSSSLTAFTAMFGYTSSEIAYLCSEYSKSKEFAAAPFEGVSDIMIKQCVGYNFGFKDKRGLPACFDKCIWAVRCSKSKSKRICIELAKLMQSTESCHYYYQLLNEQWSALLLFVSRLVYNFNSGDTGCAVGNDSLPGTIEFTLKESHCIYDDNPVCLDFFITWLVQNAYLTIAPDSSLNIPNNYTRGMWESVLLFTVHGTHLQLNQDTERQRLIDSLYHSNTSVLSETLEFMWEQLADSVHTLSAAKLIETTFAFIAGRLTAPQHIAPYGRYLQELVILFNFVYIYTDGTADTHNALEQAAEASLIAEQDIYCGDLKLNVGIAIGQSGFAIKALDRTKVF
ncbi:hypothetical protein EV183_000450 [Coemansia sp. RSA 2336]|nr:hypothetical protein EV183_000450 [Coemansia sp. RSA 2336]